MPSLPSNPSPEILDAFYMNACRAQQDGELEKARHDYQELLQFFPTAGFLNYNLGLVEYELGNFSQAQTCFSAALAENSADVDSLFNLGLCCMAREDFRGAVERYLLLLKIEPDHIDALYNLGGCYRHLAEATLAIDCYQSVLALDPHYAAALNNLAYLYHRAGDSERAEHFYGRLLAVRPDDEAARYMLDALSGIGRENAPDSYVQSFFDSYAASFEQCLVSELDYTNPRQLQEWVVSLLGDTAHFARGIDLGCGTGLSGVAFAGLVEVLDGVDLSPLMLARAEEKGVYVSLSKEGIVPFLAGAALREPRYDIFIATDVFIYVGALEPVFEAAHSVAAAGAYFCFSTEQLDEAEGFCLRQSGRFAYSRNYIEQRAAATGWQILGCRPCRLRREREDWIMGDLWLARVGD